MNKSFLFFYDFGHLKFGLFLGAFYGSPMCVQIYVKLDSDPINHYTCHGKEIV